MVEEVYRLGTALFAGEAPVRGLISAVNWGAPIVELGQPDWSQMGMQAIKELSKINKVDITYHWHFMQHPEGELAIPDTQFSEMNKGQVTSDDRARDVDKQINWAKDVGAKSIVVHPTTTIPRVHEDTFVFYNAVADSVQSGKVPEHIWDKVEKGEISAEEAREEMLTLIRERVKTQIPGQIANLDHNIRMMGNYADEAVGKLRIAEIGKKNMSKAIEEVTGGKTLSPKEREMAEYQIKQLISQEGEFIKQASSFGTEVKMLEKQKQLIQDEYGRFLPPQLRGEGDKWKDYPILTEKDMVYDNKKTTEKIADTFVRNFLPAAEKAIRAGIKIGVENMDSRYYFSHPDEINVLLDKLTGALRAKGYSDEQIKEHIGLTFDYGHANTMVGFKIKREVEIINPDGTTSKKEIEIPYGAKDIRTPIDVAERVGHPVQYVHYHENYGDVDLHLPMGATVKEGEDKAKHFKQLQEFLKSKGFEPRIIQEGFLGPREFTGFAYATGLRTAFPEYSTAQGMPATAAASFGPSYVASLPFDPIIEKGKEGESFFFPSWATGDLF